MVLKIFPISWCVVAEGFINAKKNTISHLSVGNGHSDNQECLYFQHHKLFCIHMRHSVLCLRHTHLSYEMTNFNRK